MAITYIYVTHIYNVYVYNVMLRGKIKWIHIKTTTIKQQYIFKNNTYYL